jgi:hypothetical protein
VAAEVICELRDLAADPGELPSNLEDYIEQ